MNNIIIGSPERSKCADSSAGYQNILNMVLETEHGVYVGLKGINKAERSAITVSASTTIAVEAYLFRRGVGVGF